MHASAAWWPTLTMRRSGVLVENGERVVDRGSGGLSKRSMSSETMGGSVC